MEPLKTLRVLIFSPAPSLGGGVVEFSELLKRSFSSGIRHEWFLIGQRPGRIGRMLRFLVPLIDAARLGLLLLHERHDVYHLNPSLNARAVWRDALFVLVLRLFGRKNILTFFRGWDATYFSAIAASPLRRLLFVGVFGQSRRILVLAASFARDLVSLGVRAGLIETFTTMFDGRRLLAVTRVRQDTGIQILFLARLVGEKGIFELLEAFRLLASDDMDTKLVVAGEGVESSRIRHWCLQNDLVDRISLPGYVRDVAKAQLLADSDIFVLPTYHGEGCPNALLESMGAGLPVVVTAVGGIPDVVDREVNGLFVDPGDVDSLQRAIGRLISDRRLRIQIGRNNRRKAWTLFEAQTVTRRLETLYRDCSTGC